MFQIFIYVKVGDNCYSCRHRIVYFSPKYWL